MLEIEERYKKNWTDLLFTKQIYGYQKNLIYCSINGHSTEWVKKSSKWKDQKSASKPGRVRLKVFYLGVSEYYMIFAAFLGRLIFTLRFIVRKNKDFFSFHSHSSSVKRYNTAYEKDECPIAKHIGILQ